MKKENSKTKMGSKILFSVSLILLGISIAITYSALKYDPVRTEVSLMSKNQKGYYQIKKSNSYFSEAEKKQVKNFIPKEIEYQEVVYYLKDKVPVSFEGKETSSTNLYYGFTQMNENIFSKDTEILGRKPENPNEILITNYLADHLLKKELYVWKENEQELQTFTNYEELLEEENQFVFGQSAIKITGIAMVKEKDLNQKENKEQFLYGVILPSNMLYVTKEFASFFLGENPDVTIEYPFFFGREENEETLYQFFKNFENLSPTFSLTGAYSHDISTFSNFIKNAGKVGISISMILGLLSIIFFLNYGMRSWILKEDYEKKTMVLQSIPIFIISFIVSILLSVLLMFLWNQYASNLISVSVSFLHLSLPAIICIILSYILVWSGATILFPETK